MIKHRARTRWLARWIACTLTAGMVVGSASASAQVTSVRPDSSARDSTALRADSLAARLARAEAAIELLRRQLAMEAGSTVKTRSRLQLELSGRVLTNTYFTNGRTNSGELPLLVRDPLSPSSPALSSPGTRTVGLSLRQTFIGAALSVDSVLGATFVGDIDVDFFGGGTAYAADPFAFPEVRLRTVNAQLRWQNTTLMVGSETPLISDLNPVSLAAAGTPEFALAGNLWNWIPQVRLSRTFARATAGTTPVSWSVHGAMLAPASGFRHPAEPDAVDAGERSGRPAIEARLGMQWGGPDAPEDERGEIGFGVHRGWLRVSGDTLTVARAVAADARVGFTHGITFLAEGFAGRAISSLGGGGIGQSFGAPIRADLPGPPVRDVAGWAQINVQVRPTLQSGVGCGLDVARASDRPKRLRNGACEAHLLWRPTQPVLLGVEIRRLRTVYASGPERATHFNIALGFEW